MNTPNHAAREHAPLNPSSAHMWLWNCEGWLEIAADAPDTPSTPAAEEGTRCHEIAEPIVAAPFRDTPVTAPHAITPERAEKIKPFVDYCWDLREMFDDAEFHAEERITLVKDVIYGSGDACLICWNEKTIYVADLKAGRSVVNAERNDQCCLYALAALETYVRQRGELLEDLIRKWKVVVAICQAANEEKNGVDEWVADSAYLLKVYRQAELRAQQYLAIKDGLVSKHLARTPGPHCGYQGSQNYGCPAYGVCPERIALAAEAFPTEVEEVHKAETVDEKAVAMVKATLPAPQTLSPESRALVQAHGDEIVAWVKAVQAYNHGDPPPGWKLVEGSSRRQIDEAKAVEILEEMGLDPYEQKFVGLSKAEKLMGKAKGDLAPAISKPAGQPILAPADDPRAAFCPFPADEEVQEDEL